MLRAYVGCSPKEPYRYLDECSAIFNSKDGKVHGTSANAYRAKVKRMNCFIIAGFSVHFPLIWIYGTSRARVRTQRPIQLSHEKKKERKKKNGMHCSEKGRDVGDY